MSRRRYNRNGRRTTTAKERKGIKEVEGENGKKEKKGEEYE